MSKDDNINEEDVAEVVSHIHSKPVKLSFELFHPLDHWPWQQRCRTFYGGWRRHLYLAWEYRWRDGIIYEFRRPVQWLVLCRIGCHDWLTWWNHSAGFRTRCWFCSQSRETRDYEKFTLPGE